MEMLLAQARLLADALPLPVLGYAAARQWKVGLLPACCACSLVARCIAFTARMNYLQGERELHGR
ncbi:hypothetical protein Dimus_016522, partial [Dionaea muscipula]